MFFLGFPKLSQSFFRQKYSEFLRELPVKENCDTTLFFFFFPTLFPVQISTENYNLRKSQFQKSHF